MPSKSEAWLKTELRAFTQDSYAIAHGVLYTKLLSEADSVLLAHAIPMSVERLAKGTGKANFNRTRIKISETDLQSATRRIESAVAHLLLIRLDAIMNGAMDVASGNHPGETFGALEGRLLKLRTAYPDDKMKRLCKGAFLLKQRRNDLVHNHGHPSPKNREKLLGFGLTSAEIDTSLFNRDAVWSDIARAKGWVRGVASKFAQMP